MNKDIDILDFPVMAYKGLTTGPIHVKIFCAFLIVTFGFAGIVIWDAIQGRNCSKGFIANDSYSYLSTPVCFVRGFIEPLPRARGWEGRSNRRP